MIDQSAVAEPKFTQPVIDFPRRNRTISSFLADAQVGMLKRLIGIKRNGDAVRIRILDPDVDVNAEMTWYEDWNAWSVRIAKGPYQQLCIFERSEPSS